LTLIQNSDSIQVHTENERNATD